MGLRDKGGGSEKDDNEVMHWIGKRAPAQAKKRGEKAKEAEELQKRRENNVKIQVATVYRQANFITQDLVIGQFLNI